MLVPYVGGPVIRCPAVYNSFWGPSWGDVTHQTLAKQINQFTQDLLASNFMNILTQYGELLGAGSGAFIRASSLPGVQSVLTVQSYQQIIQQCINAGAFPQAVDLNAALSIPMLMIYLDEHTVINGGGRQLNFPGAPDLAYHDSFVTANGHPCVYAFMAFLPLNELTWVASHEFAEAVTDPLYNAWTPDHAFHEIGDYCEGNNSSITVSGRTWTVQTIWSDTNNACIVPPAAPIPALHPGPFGAADGARAAGVARLTAARGALQIAPHDRVLPLPSIQFDLTSGTHAMDPAEVSVYVKKMFHPLKHDQLLGNTPEFLRSFAGLLEQTLASEDAPNAPAPSNAPDTASDASRAAGVARRG